MMSSSQNRATDKHIIWSDINLNPDDWRDNYKDFLEINEIDGDPNDEHMDTIRDSIETRANDVLKRDKNRESR